jgi:hypothetical protein
VVVVSNLLTIETTWYFQLSTSDIDLRQTNIHLATEKAAKKPIAVSRKRREK